MPAETVLFTALPPFAPGHPKSRRARHVYTNLKRATRRRSSTSASRRQQRPCTLCEYTRTLDVPAKARVRLVYFVHVPKTGGAALKLALHASAAAVPSCSTVQSVLLRGRRRHQYTRVVSVGHNGVRDVDPRVPTFCILRDPYERIRSAFRYVMEGGKHAAVWTMPQKHTMDKWTTRGITTVADLFATPAQRTETLAHPHFRPMTTFVTDTTGALAVDKVFFQDALDPRAIAAYLGIAPFALPVKNQSGRPYTLTSADRACVAKHYAEDIALYEAAHIKLYEAAHKASGGGGDTARQPSRPPSSASSRSRRAPAHWTPPPPLPTGATTLYIRPPLVTHFWHFMMGEFLPVVASYLACRPRPRVVHVYKADVASPLNAFYRELSTEGRKFVVSATRDVPHSMYHRLPNTHNGWDWYHRQQDVAPLLQTVHFLRTWALAEDTRTPTRRTRSPVQVRVQLRKNTTVLNTHYANLHTRRERRKHYGADRRCVTNLDAVAAALRKALPADRATVRTVADDGISLREQIRQYADAQVLVLGHGAGMVHALWMRAPVTLVEIIDRHKLADRNGAVQGCKRLVRILTTKRQRARLHRVVVDDAHAAVDVGAVVAHVTRAVDRRS